MCKVYKVWVGDGTGVPRRFVHVYKNVVWYSDLTYFVKRFLTDEQMQKMKDEDIVRYFCDKQGYSNAILFRDENDVDRSLVYFDVENIDEVVKAVSQYVDTVERAWCLALRRGDNNMADLFEECYSLSTYMVGEGSCLDEAKSYIKRYGRE